MTQRWRRCVSVRMRACLRACVDARDKACVHVFGAW